MKIKVYISVNTLPNTNYILALLLSELSKANLNCEITIIHDSRFELHLFKNLTTLNLKFKKEDDNLFEFPALRTMWLDSKEDDFYALYLHVKGASKVDYIELQNSISWLEYMLFGVLTNSAVCIDHMNAGADIVGSMWHNHFKGNFFWCKSSYAKTLLDPYNFTISSRFNAEYWISMPFDKHWSSQSKEIFGITLVQPLIKNLFYLPIENDLTDFLLLKNANWKPDLTKKQLFNDISLVTNCNFFAYDELYISKENFIKFKNDLKPYLNYDAKINIQ